MQDELRSSVERALAGSDLPPQIQKKIYTVVSGLALGVDETYEVTLELLAHFEDGLSAGRPQAELLASFGDEHTIVDLITKAKGMQPLFRQNMEYTMGGDSFFRTLWRNLRYAGRRLAQSPGFTATAVLSLALGIGANTAIFSLVNAVILRDPPFEKPEELVDVLRTAPDFPFGTFSYPDFEDLRDGTQDVFSGVSATEFLLVQTDRHGGVETIPAEAVSGTHFPLLGIEAGLGRTLHPEDDLVEGAHPVVMLGHGYWKRAFGADPEVVGKEIRLGRRLYTIIGVASEDYPGSFRGLSVAVFAPMAMVNELQPGGDDDLKSRSIQSLFVKARLAPGVTIAQAQAIVDGVADHLRELDLEDFDPDTGFQIVPMGDVILMPGVDPYIRTAASLLMAVVGLVLLIACTNLTSFLLAQGVDRRKEIALRIALGAGRRNLMGQLLSETLLLGILGGVAGVAAAVWILQILVTTDFPLPLPITLDLSLNLTVLGFSVGISILAGIILGLAPVIQSTRPDIASTLRDVSTGGSASGRLTLRNTLVVAQVAGSFVLLITAGLFLRSAEQIQSVDPGFGREPTAILSLFIAGDRYPEEEGRAFTRTLLERFRELPGVEAVGLMGNIHLNAVGRRTVSIQVDGVEPPPGREFFTVDYSAVDPGLFNAAGIRIVRGRNFTEHDLPDSLPVVLVNQTFSEKFWPGRDPIGRRIQRRGAPDYTVVGVTSNAKIRTLGEPPRPFIYRPYSQSYAPFIYVLARTSIDPERTAHDMLTAGRELDPDLWVWEAKTMERHLGVQRFPARLTALVLSALAVLALTLASIGLHGIVSYAVSRRTREVGIRMSLGADRAGVIRMLMGSGMKLFAMGAVIGLGIAYSATRLLTDLLHNVGALDPITFLTVSAVLAAAAMLAAYVPARRAGRVDPATALRTE